jgi:asparagine synthase (glutamine-hydrolysing)
MWKNNMNPEQLWYDNNENVRKTLDSYYSSHIELLNDYKGLRNDVIELYKTGNITEKTQVLTLLSACKLLFE